MKLTEIKNFEEYFRIFYALTDSKLTDIFSCEFFFFFFIKFISVILHTSTNLGNQNRF